MFRPRIIAAALLLASTAYGQQLRLNLDHLATRAKETVEVTLDENMLGMASGFLSRAKPDEAKVKELIGSIKGIYVRSFEFAGKGEYTAKDLESVRSQLRTPDWTRIVNVQSRGEGENAEIYLRSEGGKPAGLAIIAAEPTELTIVQIIGPIALDQLGELANKFSIIPNVKVSKPTETQEKSKGNKD